MLFAASYYGSGYTTTSQKYGNGYSSGSGGYATTSQKYGNSNYGNYNGGGYTTTSQKYGNSCQQWLHHY